MYVYFNIVFAVTETMTIFGYLSLVHMSAPSLVPLFTSYVWEYTGRKWSTKKSS